MSETVGNTVKPSKKKGDYEIRQPQSQTDESTKTVSQDVPG